MQYFAALFCIAIPLLGIADAQETNPQSSVAAPVILAEQTYLFQLIEFRIKSPLDPKLGAKEIVQMFDQLHKDGKIEVIENVRLSTLERHESLVTFGVRTPVTTSTGGNAQSRVRSYQSQNIGTIIHVKASPQSGKVLIEFAYERSYLNGKGTDDLPPDIIQSTFKSTLLLETGKPTLVGGTTSDASDFLIVTISK